MNTATTILVVLFGGFFVLFWAFSVWELKALREDMETQFDILHRLTKIIEEIKSSQV